MSSDNVVKIRERISRDELTVSQVDSNPVRLFSHWMEQAVEARVEEPTAMTLATASRDGVPSARMVLLKGFDESGFVFYTNYHSRKARELDSNPSAALVFFWKEVDRQVRIEGHIEKVSPGESDEYFDSRPKDSQVSAIISPQSSQVPDREYLEKLRDDYLEKHSGKNKRPDYWGGYRLIPVMIEFWQKRPGRLHDRVRYMKSADSWAVEMLAP